MKNIYNNLIFSLGIISIIALFLIAIFPITTNAYFVNGSYTTKGSYLASDGSQNNNSNTNSIPTLYLVNPTKLGINSGLESVTISGTGFKPDSIARWNGSDRPTSYINSSKLIMELDRADTSAEGKYQIDVVNPTIEGGKFSNPKIITVPKYIGDESRLTASNPTNDSYKTSQSTTLNSTNNTSTTYKETSNTSSRNIENNQNSNTRQEANSLKVNNNNSFMPDTILEWLILIGLLILAVILFRRIWVTEKDKKAPLKHA